VANDTTCFACEGRGSLIPKGATALWVPGIGIKHVECPKKDPTVLEEKTLTVKTLSSRYNGEPISVLARHLCLFAREGKCRFVTSKDGVQLQADPDTTPEEVVEVWGRNRTASLVKALCYQKDLETFLRQEEEVTVSEAKELAEDALQDIGKISNLDLDEIQQLNTKAYIIRRLLEKWHMENPSP
jgi:hypothetical protein